MYLYQSNSTSQHQKNEIGGHKSAQIVSEKENKEVRKNEKTSNNQSSRQ